MSLHTSDLVLVPGRQLKPLDNISGFQVRPGFFRFFGATIIPGGVNFTIQSHGATSCELLLFHREAEEPFAALKFPDNYKIGFVYSISTSPRSCSTLMPEPSPDRASGGARTILSTATVPGSYRTTLTGDWSAANQFPWRIL